MLTAMCGCRLQGSALADRLQDAHDAAQQAEVQRQSLEAKAEQLQAWLHEKQMQVSWDQSHCSCLLCPCSSVAVCSCAAPWVQGMCACCYKQAVWPRGTVASKLVFS
jgi:hypothetical protein